ncbi:proline-rich protein 2-like [Sorex fumeus]|uniref:proline-rich protein 2-like n=1 Tax=Sorex fumeus TaxID=62283 RepID=UPI0024AC84D3|nr:proline-rich protein 2-like [Sorex fumeus]
MRPRHLPDPPVGALQQTHPLPRSTPQIHPPPGYPQTHSPSRSPPDPSDPGWDSPRLTRPLGPPQTHSLPIPPDHPPPGPPSPPWVPPDPSATPGTPRPIRAPTVSPRPTPCPPIPPAGPPQTHPRPRDPQTHPSPGLPRPAPLCQPPHRPGFPAEQWHPEAARWQTPTRPETRHTHVVRATARATNRGGVGGRSANRGRPWGESWPIRDRDGARLPSTARARSPGPARLRAEAWAGGWQACPAPGVRPASRARPAPRSLGLERAPGAAC